jgi:hypothetical protein
MQKLNVLRKAKKKKKKQHNFLKLYKQNINILIQST